MRVFGVAPVLLLVALLCTGSGAQPQVQPTPPVTPTAALGQPFELAPGEAMTIADNGLQVTFGGVREDSRCPTGVACVWAGRVTVEMAAQPPAEVSEPFELSTEGTRHITSGGQVIELLDVAPERPAPGQAIDARDYRVRLVVTAPH